jgi:curved DNA-binding protein CbpA
LSYYDDLGVAQDASPEQIRESYRTLVRLLHPDQQTDPALKRSAEGQMRRINQVAAVLGDPERRRGYDAELAGRMERAAPIVIQSLPTPKRPVVAFGNLVWIVAAVASGGMILWLSTQGGPLGSAPAPPPDEVAAAERIAVPARRPAIDVRTRSGSVGVPKVDPQEPSALKTEQAIDDPSRKPEIVREIPTIAFDPEPPKLPEVALVATNVRSPFAGFWVFPRMREENKDKSLYLPEFIEASIVERDGVLKGKYRSRYRIRDRAISPNVNFEFEGKASGTTAKLPWHGEGGSRGEVMIKTISDHSIEVVWSATNLGQSLALKAGTAVLMRRPD